MNALTWEATEDSEWMGPEKYVAYITMNFPGWTPNDVMYSLKRKWLHFDENFVTEKWYDIAVALLFMSKETKSVDFNPATLIEAWRKINVSQSGYGYQTTSYICL